MIRKPNRHPCHSFAPWSACVPLLLSVLTLGIFCTSGAAAEERAEPWTFVSMPDFLNVDTTYPQPGWEDALDFILKQVVAENPEFLMVAGDLVMGHWQTKDEIDQYAAVYYPAWVKRLEDHRLRFYATIGDHELGDNPWPAWKTALVPAYKEAFCRYLKMPENGPESFRGTAFWWREGDLLFIAIDPFEFAQGSQGGVTAQVTGEQLVWLEDVLKSQADARATVVMGHVPILGPVRSWSSSRLMLKGAERSPLWSLMAKYKVDLYLCGEVHAITCIERDGVMQVAHGGLIGYNSRTNYLVGRVFPDRIELMLKEIDIIPSGPKLWQPGTNRPLEKVDIPQAARDRGAAVVGRIVLETRPGENRWTGATGYFSPEMKAKPGESYRPFGASAPPRVNLDE